VLSIFAGLALTLGGLIALFNWYSVYASYKSGRHVSPVLLLGGFLMFAGLLLLPKVPWYAWLAIAADYGTIVFALAIPSLIRQSWDTSDRQVVHEFAGESNGRRDNVRLFKNGKFAITLDYHPPVPCNRMGATASSQGIVGSWREEAGDFVLEKYREQRVLRIHAAHGVYRTEEAHYPDEREFPIDRLDALTLTKLR
jgi:hypothetical protein